MSHYDFMPTLLDYLGMEGPQGENLPGRSFAPILHGETLEREDEAIVICDEYGPNRMFRTRDWKYVHRYPEGPNELYHLAEDPGEKHNLIDDPAAAEMKEALHQRLDAWFETYVIPELDAAKCLECSGRGQRNVVGKSPDQRGIFKPLNMKG